MILLKQPQILDAVAFAAGLQRASRGVVRVSFGEEGGRGQGVTTGWLITETLVVLAAHAASLGAKAVCSFATERDQVAGGVVLTTTHTAAGDPDVALVRLEMPVPDRALTIGIETPLQDDQVFLLHHPEGNPRQVLSIGRLIAVDGDWLRYDADTTVGSSGAPVFDTQWSVIGMHIGWRQIDTSPKPGVNFGSSLAAILRGLSTSPEWGEIERHHRLANVASAQEALGSRAKAPAPISPDDFLVRVAVRWRFDPKSLAQSDRDRVKPLVVEPSAKRWTLRAPERQRLFRAAGSVDALRQARGHETIDDDAQRAIDHILTGPPYALEDVPEAELPYWLQAVRWFSEVVPGLPTPAEVNRTLERKRVRGRLRELAGDRFRGREAQLAQLRSWYDDGKAGPMVVSGIGGVGKSALVSRFAERLPGDTLLLWLDFDRVDLAPDDAVSVLSLLCRQTGVQTEGFVAPPLSDKDWETAADLFGAELARISARTPPPLLVLDGFEVAQYVRRHQEIWAVLERVLARAPEVRVLVSGRAPVADLELRGRPAQALILEGMDRKDAEAWLRESGLTDADVVRSVLDISRCEPLKLKLALRLIEKGGSVSDLPQELVEGFLYQRILDRVIDPALKPLVRGALVLRRLSAAMTAEVLGGVLPSGLDAREVYERLAREMAIVAGEDAGQAGADAAPEVLRLRPEVRSATLKLLELDDATNVRAIDERAAAWYARQDLEEVVNAAELVYHRLRLADLPGAKKAWRDGCAPLLLYAIDELPEHAKAERNWLRRQTSGSDASGGLKAWEQDALDRIHAALGRGLLRSVPKILAEREEQSHGRAARSLGSPLVVYDAWALWNAGDLAGARATLQAAGIAEGPPGHDRAVVGALLAARDGDLRGADRLLTPLERNGSWIDRSRSDVEALTALAARVRLTVDWDAELTLAAALKDEAGGGLLKDELRRFLTPMDVVLPRLSRMLRQGTVVESAARFITVPTGGKSTRAFAAALDDYRTSALVSPPPFTSRLRLSGLALTDDDGPWGADDLDLDSRTKAMARKWDVLNLGLRLAVLGWRRWRLAATSVFLAHACKMARRPDDKEGLMGLAVTGTLGLFRGDLSAGYRLQFEGDDLDKIITSAIEGNRSLTPDSTVGRLRLTARALELEVGPNPTTSRIDEWLAKRTSDEKRSAYELVRGHELIDILELSVQMGQQILIVTTLGPDPLESLCRLALGLPEDVSL